MVSSLTRIIKAICIIILCLFCVRIGEAKASLFSGNLPNFALQTRECFAEPGACGYPDPAYHDVGALSICSGLTPSASVIMDTRGGRVEGLNISGGIYIGAENVTVTNDCLNYDGGGELNGEAMIRITAEGGGAKISHVSAQGKNATTESVQLGITNDANAPGVTVSNVYVINCGECIHGGLELTNSYVDSTAQIVGEHIEDWYFEGTTIVARHNTMINPEGQTADIFGDTGGVAGDNHLTVENNLLAGGGYTIYANANSTEAGTSTMTIRHNHFARCLGERESTGGGHSCKGGIDSHGFFPDSGFYGWLAAQYCPPVPGQVWEGNVLDNNLTEISCAGHIE